MSIFKFPPFYDDTSHIALGSTSLHYDLIVTKFICNDPISKSGFIRRSWGLGHQHVDWGGGTQFSP